MKVRKRDENYSIRTVTSLWQEVPSVNPYLAEHCRCHGYDILELAGKKTFTEVLFLLFHGELPSQAEVNLLEKLMICFINPGPRHPAVRASMNAAVSRSNTAHYLPIGMAVAGGSSLGGQEVYDAMSFLRDNVDQDPDELAGNLLKKLPASEGDLSVAPGFGNRFSGIDPLPQKVAEMLVSLPAAGKAIAWGTSLVRSLIPHGLGWKTTGVAAAVFSDLGFHRLAGAGLFQYLCAPGILAHAVEVAQKPLTAMPFLDKEHYVIAPEAKKR